MNVCMHGYGLYVGLGIQTQVLWFSEPRLLLMEPSLHPLLYFKDTSRNWTVVLEYPLGVGARSLTLRIKGPQFLYKSGRLSAQSIHPLS